jgi:hypothetical protein
MFGARRTPAGSALARLGVARSMGFRGRGEKVVLGGSGRQATYSPYETATGLLLRPGRGAHGPRIWLKVIARRRCIDYLRWHDRRKGVESADRSRVTVRSREPVAVFPPGAADDPTRYAPTRVRGSRNTYRPLHEPLILVPA